MIGKRLKLLRKKIKITQTEFGKRIGVTLGTVQNWEAEKTIINETAIKLIESQFNIRPEWLRTGEGEILKENDNNDKEFEKLFDLMKKYSTPTMREELEKKLLKIKEIQDSE